MDTIAKEDINKMFVKDDYKDTKIRIEIYIKVNQSEKFIPMNESFREV